MKRTSTVIVVFLTILLVVSLVACYTPNDEAQIVKVSNATINGQEIRMFVDYDTDSVALDGKVQTSYNSVWTLSYDSWGQQQLQDKIAKGADGELLDGYNDFYIIVTSESKKVTNTYKLTIYRSFEVNVSYYDGQTLLKKDTAYTGKEYQIVYEPTLAGCTFNYWYLQNEYLTSVTSLIPWDDVTLYANKTTNSFTLTLNVNGGNDLDETEYNVEYGSTFELPVPTCGDNVFGGWYYGEEKVTDEQGRSIGVWSYENGATLTAHWTIMYTVTVDATAGGTITGDSGKYEQGETLALTAQTLDGYTWLGWFKNGVQYSMQFNLNVVVEEDAIYTANWIEFPIAVNFQVSGTVKNDYEYVAQVNLPSKSVAGEQITLTAPQTSQLGYEFVGWYDSSFSYTGKLLSAELEYTLEVPSVATKLYVRYDKKAEMSSFSFTSTDVECTITSYSSSDVVDVVIPDYVTAILSSNSARGVFQAMNIQTIVIGAGVTELERYAFNNCQSLTRVELKGEVSYIGESAFYRCAALQSISFGNALKTVGLSAFSQCTVLNQIGDTSNIETLCKEAFYKCPSLTSISLPSIKSIGQNAFYQCTALTSVELGQFSTEGVLLSSSLVELGESAFAESGLTSIVIPGSVQTIGGSAFSKCKSLSNITIEDGVEVLDMYCFQYCPIVNIELPDSITTLNYTFYNCSKLETIKFGTGLNYISISTFYGCSALKEAEFAVSDGWVRRNNASETGGIVVTEFGDKTTAAALLRQYASLQKFVREDV